MPRDSSFSSLPCGGASGRGAFLQTRSLARSCSSFSGRRILCVAAPLVKESHTYTKSAGNRGPRHTTAVVLNHIWGQLRLTLETLLRSSLPHDRLPPPLTLVFHFFPLVSSKFFPGRDRETRVGSRVNLDDSASFPFHFPSFSRDSVFHTRGSIVEEREKKKKGNRKYLRKATPPFESTVNSTAPSCPEIA